MYRLDLIGDYVTLYRKKMILNTSNRIASLSGDLDQQLLCQSRYTCGLLLGCAVAANKVALFVRPSFPTVQMALAAFV
jgi:hypothetical protein